MFSEIIFGVKDDAYRVAYSYLHDEHEAMDCVCNAIEKAYKNLKKIKEERFFKTWFIRLTINECKMYLRKKKRVIYMADDISNSEDNYQDIEGKLDLKSILSKLPSQERTLLHMKYYLGYTFDDISGITGMPEGTVKTKIYSSLKLMRDKFRI